MSSMRISGIASGMDTETMVSELMKAEKAKVDRFNKEKTLVTWRQEQYTQINKDIANFILDTRKELFGTSSYSKSPNTLDWVNKATSSNESIFTASADPTAPTGTHTMKVTQIAKGVNVASVVPISATKDAKLSELGITDDGNTSVADGSISFDIDGTNTVTIEYDATDTVKDLVDKINSAMGDDGDANTPEVSLGIQASFDDINGRLFLSTKGTGKDSQIKIIGDTGELFTAGDKFKLGLTLNTAKTGENAIVEFDGATGLEYSSNNFTVNGININLNSVSSNPATDEFTIKVDTDIDGIHDKIKDFVDKYNELIGNLNKELSEKRYRDYNPLSKEEKEAMKEADVKLWEEKAKSGLLRNDDYINRLIGNVRGGLYEEVKDNDGNKLEPYSSLYEIGITTGEWKDKGKLTIDEDKLTEALKNDAEGVMNVLFKTPDSSDDDNTDKMGIVNRIYSDMVDGMKDMIKKAGTGGNDELYRDVKSTILVDFVTNGGAGKGSISILDEDVIDYEKIISKEEERLIQVESRYWAQFSAMEKALSEMNSQSSWIASQLG